MKKTMLLILSNITISSIAMCGGQFSMPTNSLDLRTIIATPEPIVNPTPVISTDIIYGPYNLTDGPIIEAQPLSCMIADIEKGTLEAMLASFYEPKKETENAIAKLLLPTLSGENLQSKINNALEQIFNKETTIADKNTTLYLQAIIAEHCTKIHYELLAEDEYLASLEKSMGSEFTREIYLLSESFPFTHVPEAFIEITFMKSFSNIYYNTTLLEKVLEKHPEPLEKITTIILEELFPKYLASSKILRDLIRQN